MKTRVIIGLLIVMLLSLLQVLACGCQSTHVENMSLFVPGGGAPVCETGLQPPPPAADTADAETPASADEVVADVAPEPTPPTPPQPITVIIGNTKTVATSAADAGDGKSNLWSWLSALAAGGALGALAAP